MNWKSRRLFGVPNRIFQDTGIEFFKTNKNGTVPTGTNEVLSYTRLIIIR